jgi:DNA-binding transcriptional ArsR family regulator
VAGAVSRPSDRRRLSRPDRRIVAAVRGAAERWERDAWLTDVRASRPGDHIVSRCLALVAALAETADGMRSVEIAEQLGVSRATVDRDLEALRRAGVLIETEMAVEDGVAMRWHRLPGT